MVKSQQKETMVTKKVTYTLEVNGKIIIVENVPARVSLETGEQFFSPETVERLQQMVWEKKKPNRMIKVPVFEFAS
jgi:YgiT-type zinc finger domain-containing protein